MGFRPTFSPFQRLPPVRISLRKYSNKTITKSLPKITVYNARSLFPKLSSLITDMKERSIDVCCICEIWEENKKKKKRKMKAKTHQQKIEEMMEMVGIDYISTPRLNRMGGGAAVAVNTESFSISKLDVHIPTDVEAVWGLLKPKEPNPQFPV